MAQKCMLWMKHDFEFVPNGNKIRCARCHRRWEGAGYEVVPSGEFSSWLAYEADQERKHNEGRWDIFKDTGTGTDGRGNLTIEEAALAYAQAIIKRNGWQEPARKKPPERDLFKERREELVTVATLYPEDFLKKIFG